MCWGHFVNGNRRKPWKRWCNPPPSLRLCYQRQRNLHRCCLHPPPWNRRHQSTVERCNLCDLWHRLQAVPQGCIVFRPWQSLSRWLPVWRRSSTDRVQLLFPGSCFQKPPLCCSSRVCGWNTCALYTALVEPPGWKNRLQVSNLGLPISKLRRISIRVLAACATLAKVQPIQSDHFNENKFY